MVQPRDLLMMKMRTLVADLDESGVTLAEAQERLLGEYLRVVLIRHGAVQLQAAAELGIHRNQMTRLMLKAGVVIRRGKKGARGVDVLEFKL